MILHIKLEMIFTPWPGSVDLFQCALRLCCSSGSDTLLCWAVCLVVQSCPMFTDFNMVLLQGMAERRAGLSSCLSHWYWAGWLGFSLSPIKISLFFFSFLLSFFFYFKLILAAASWTPQFSHQPYEVLRAHMVSPGARSNSCFECLNFEQPTLREQNQR